MSSGLAILNDDLIKKQNKAFHKLSNKNKRIAIAKDVLQQIKLKAYYAQPGTYFQAGAPIDRNDDSLVFQKALLEKNFECEVCALGAAICSFARLGDEVTELAAYRPHFFLEGIFGKYQVALIETAFEGRPMGMCSYLLSAEDIKATNVFFNKYGGIAGEYSKAEKRLAAIFRNIIRNNGIFKP